MNRFSGDKFSGDKFSGDKFSGDKFSGDKFSGDGSHEQRRLGSDQFRKKLGPTADLDDTKNQFTEYFAVVHPRQKSAGFPRGLAQLGGSQQEDTEIGRAHV